MRHAKCVRYARGANTRVCRVALLGTHGISMLKFVRGQLTRTRGG